VKEKGREGLATAPRTGAALAGKIAVHAAQIPNRLGAGAIKSAKQLFGSVCYFTGVGAIPASVVNFYLEAMYARAARGYQAGFYPGRVIVLNTEDAQWDSRQGFERLTGGLKIVEIDAKHDQVMYWEEQIQLVAEKIKFYLEEAQAGARAHRA
jgi:hypothetical protein